MVYLDGVGIDYRDGDKIYLKGSVSGIVTSDEICVVFLYPGSSTHHNIPSTVSERQYIYFKDASGDYDLAANGRYIPFVNEGNYAVRIIDVSGTCENWIRERGIMVFLILEEVVPELPDIFQYQVIFDLANPLLGDNKYLLEAEYAKFEAAGWREVTHEDPDCFPLVALHGGDVPETPQAVWLCQAIEYGKSPCDPLPYWLCPWPSPETIYFRGECSCDHFQEVLQPLGIPCCHLIAALKWYAGKPAYCPYVQCP